MRLTKSQFYWILYDWASSAVPTIHTTFIFSVYFTTILMPDGGTVYWAFMTGFTAFLLGLSAPFLGRLADRHGHNRLGLNLCTLLGAMAMLALWFIHPALPQAPMLALLLSSLIIFFTELAFIYYNSFLPLLAPRSSVGRLSGYGWGIGYMGAILALSLVLFLLIRPSPPLFGLDAEMYEPLRLSMVCAGLWMLLFALPFMVTAPASPAKNRSAKPHSPPPKFWQDMRHAFRLAMRIEGMARFLLARLAYADALITLFAFGGIYAARVLQFSQTDILFFAITLNLVAGLGACFSGALTDHFGPLRIIRFSIIAMFGFGVICLITSSHVLFWGASIALGFFIGPCQAASRTWIAKRAPPGQITSLFGLLAFSGKATSFIGPVGYGLLVLVTGYERAGMVIILILFALALWLLPRSSSIN